MNAVMQIVMTYISAAVGLGIKIYFIVILWKIYQNTKK